MATDAAESAAGDNSLDFVATFCHEMGHVVARDVIPGFADALRYPHNGFPFQGSAMRSQARPNHTQSLPPAGIPCHFCSGFCSLDRPS